MLLHKCSKNVVFFNEICSKYVVNCGKSTKYVVFIRSIINKSYMPKNDEISIRYAMFGLKRTNVDSLNII